MKRLCLFEHRVAGIARAGARVALAGALLVSPGASRALAEIGDHLLMEGIAAGEAHDTDDDAYVLSSNDGKPAGEATLLLWQALRLHPSLHLFALEELEGATEDGGETEGEIEQFLIRYARGSEHRFLLEAGKLATPVGSFPSRRFPDTNPLPGDPATYATDYPYGITASGRVSIVDYEASVMSLPLRNGAFSLDADHAPRPALSVGVTPVVGFRIGAFATQGPYLGSDIEDLLPAETRWRDFEQSITGVEVHLTRGYLVINGEMAFSAYEIPTHGATEHGRAWYLEGRYTHSPRVFSAVRLEQSDYPFILPIGPFYWVAEPVTLYDYEVGMGYRFSPWTLLKVSYREEIWDVAEDVKVFYPEGYRVAVQLSQRFDVLSWFERRP